jgi:putative ABC transport system permease protein
VGLLADTKMYGLANPARLEVYVPLRQQPRRGMTILVKSSREPAPLVSAIRAAVASMDKEQPVFGVATLQEVVNASIFTQRVTLIVLALFSGLGLALAAIGTYGVVSYSVEQRTREIGIRVALGARGGDVLRLALAQGARISVTGIAIGSAAALGLTRLMTGLLYSVSAIDPATFSAVAAALALIAMAACCIPARRAMRIDPLAAIRHE